MQCVTVFQDRKVTYTVGSKYSTPVENVVADLK